MCEILVKLVDQTYPTDSVKDAAGCYKRGDPVVIMPDGHEWGREEGLPKFIVVKVPGISVANAMQYVTSTLAIRRTWRLTEAVITEAIEAGGSVTLKASEVRRAIVAK